MKIKIESDLALFSILYSLIVFSALAMIFIFFNFAIKNSDAKLISISDTQNKAIFSEANISQAASLPMKTIDPLLPVRIIIPRIKLNAVIESVGLTKTGAVGVPKIPANTAWYNLSPRPGEKGSSIITGHYGRWKNGQGSVFDNLNKLKVGDKIQVKNQKGTITKFVVKKIQKYDPKASATDVFTSSDDKSHLNLITCEGAWNKKLKSYPERLVIFTDKE